MNKWASLSHFFIPAAKGIPVLMYHEIHPQHQDSLSVKTSDFSQHLDWLLEQEYQSLSLSEFVGFKEDPKKISSLPQKPVVLTFDDGYRGVVDEALPLLQKRGLKACLFVTTAFIEEAEKKSNTRYLGLKELRKWVESGMEVALHSHSHLSYREMSPEEVSKDLKLSEQLLTSWKIPYLRVLAYPFGARPRNSKQLHQTLQNDGIRAAFRIGNRISPWSREANLFEIKRIDVRGTDTFDEFKIKVKKGRIKLF